MKILQLRFKNLNSLYGEWFIDFSDPEYVSNGIFALTGPTGAGKSTILDAICLALYGATPRLGRITKSSNEIMSRQTGECYAEVTFESQAGRFLCYWAQHRANKKADRPLQDSKHEISDAHSGRPIETKKSLVPRVIEEKTGMDFERFTRSILLAQGGFDTFLKADTEQKSKILEQITGTEIYSEISRRVHERQRAEREKLGLLLAETSGIVILEPEQEKEVQQELEEKLKEETECTGKLGETGKAITWLYTTHGLKKEIISLSEEAEKLKGAFEAFKPDRERLNLADKAAEHDGNYATLTALRKQQVAEQESLQIQEGALPALDSLAGEKEQALKNSEQLTSTTKEELKKTAPLLQKVRSLDQQLADKKKAVDCGIADCKKDAVQIEVHKKHTSKEQQKRDTAHSKLQHVLNYLETHLQDEWLVGGLAGIEELLGNLSLLQKETATKTAARKKATGELSAATRTLTGCTNQVTAGKKAMEGARKYLEEEKGKLTSLLRGGLLRQYRSEKESLLREMAYLTKIAELETYRSKLEDGKPCPLCGADTHPFAEGNVPVPDETEKKIEGLTALIREAEAHEANIKKLETVEKDALNNLADREKLEAMAANEKKASEKTLADLTADLEKTALRFTGLQDSALNKLQPLGIEVIPDSDISSLLTLLKKRLKDWQEQVIKKIEMEKLISLLDSELKRLEAVIDTKTTVLSEKKASLETVRNDFTTSGSERRKLFAGKLPDAEEARLHKAITAAELMEKQARTAWDEARQKRESARVNVFSLKERIEKRVLELKDVESNFDSQLGPAGFTDEKQFLAARLTTSERNQLKTKTKELDDKQTDLLARQKDRENRLSIEIARAITVSQLDELEPTFKMLEENLQQLRDLIAGLKHKLAENKAAKERRKEKQAAIDARKKEWYRWDKLHGLIGSADGKKYRNFAQGLTFELMVSHANRQLEKMTDRYLLIRDDKQPLELNVVDNYQAGEIRSTKNLSGGESFIVSLTLALGLSKMASRKVRVDSLFLDEGFGTLDEESLETALETLANLQQDGKLIGIISHVSALKERISTQISIAPLSGGKSSISGPGCRKVRKSKAE